MIKWERRGSIGNKKAEEWGRRETENGEEDRGIDVTRKKDKEGWK